MCETTVHALVELGAQCPQKQAKDTCFYGHCVPSTCVNNQINSNTNFNLPCLLPSFQWFPLQPDVAAGKSGGLHPSFWRTVN